MIRRVALIFDDRMRPDTTGVYARLALEKLVEVVHFQPSQREEIPTSGFDLYLSIDDDTDHRLPDRLRPLAYWAIDTHRGFRARLERARRCDAVFAAQRDGAERLKAAGLDTSTWLPLACDPGVHRRHDVPKRFDFGFVGNLSPGLRNDLLGQLRERFPNHFIGNAYFEKMAEIYSACRVVFNRSIGDDINMRVFEAVASGSLLVTNDLAANGQEDLFRDGEHLVTYRDGDELLEKVAYYLEREDEREAIAAAGRAEALARHTYRHRMEKLLAECEKVIGRQSVAVNADRPGSSSTQALSVGKPPSLPASGGLTSVIVPCFNQLEFTRQCIASLVKHTRARPWELIVVDNGSTDGTGSYLKGVQDVSPVPVTIVSNTRNLGYPAAINQGLREARGEFLVLLNNDAVVTDGWLDQLSALCSADCDPPVGLTGPMSNYATPPQLIEGVPYRDMGEMHLYAARWKAENRGKWQTVPKLSGFCVLMTRAVYDAVGGLDERFGLGFFDDDDLAERARRAGFQLAVARDLFVHHFGSQTFVGAKIDTEALLRENEARFSAKWGDSVPKGKRVALSSFATEATRRPVGERPSVSLTMIVKNEESNLPACLGSVHDLFDEVVVVDTGSTDRTVEIARGFGAKVFEFPWVDDFSAARNVALENATGDYAFWLDADDVIDAPQRARLQSLLDGLSAGDDAAYVVKCSCDPDNNGGGGQTVVDHIRLFPLRDGIRWEYRVHEQILPSLRRANIPVRWTDVTVRHTGYTDPDLRDRKLERDVGILRRELEDRPDDPFVLFNLGSIAVERKDWTGALVDLERSLASSAPTDSITRKLYALIARSRQMLGDLDGALRTCGEGLAVDPEDAELLFRRGILHRHRGELAEAESNWRRILGLRRPEQFCSVDEGIYGHLTLRNLAMLAEDRGDRAEASRLWTAVLDKCPGDHDASMRLAQMRRSPA